MSKIELLFLECNRILVRDRDLLSDSDILILKDCLELISIIQSTKDENLKKIHLLNLTLKITSFFGKGIP